MPKRLGLFQEQATYLALRREHIFEFDPADVSNRIQYDALSGTHIIENYPLDVETNGPRLSIIDYRHIATGTNEPAC